MASIFAAPKSRARLITPWALAGFAVLIGAVFKLLFPEASLLRLLTEAPRGDPLTASYLANLHELEPTNPQAALLLARTRLSQGRTTDALALASLYARSTDPELRIDLLEKVQGIYSTIGEAKLALPLALAKAKEIARLHGSESEAAAK